MKRGLVLSFLMGCVAVSNTSWAEPSTVFFRDGVKASFSLLEQSEERSRIHFAITTASGKSSAVAVTVSPGEFVEYAVETVARSETVEFFSQCPHSSPNVPLGHLQVGWSLKSGILVVFVDHNTQVTETFRCDLKGCEVDSSTSLAAEGLTVSGGEDEVYAYDPCFPEKPVATDSSIVANAPGEIADPGLPAPELDQATCDVALKSACIEPVVFNGLIVAMDNGGPVEKGDLLTQQLQRKRRLLSRALKTGDDLQLRRAIRSAVRFFSGLVGDNATLNAKTLNRIRLVSQYLRNKGPNRKSSIRRAVLLLGKRG